MKHTLFTTLTLLATTLLTGTPGLGQDGSSVGFDSSSRQGQSGTGPSRLGPAELKFTLTARGQTLVQDPAGNGLVVREDPNGKEAEGTQFLPRTGLPNISMRQVNVLLPYQADFDGLRLRVVAEETEHVGFFDIAPVSMVTSSTEDESGAFSLEEVPLDGVQLDDVGRDMMVYSSTTTWPPETLQIDQVARHRALRYARIAFAPFRWNPATGELIKVTKVQAVLRYQHRPVPPAKRDLELGDPVPLESMSLHRFLDPKDALTTYSYPPRSTKVDYLIITTGQVAQGSLALDSFIDMKESQGHSVGVKTVEQIELSHPAASRADSIRKYLRANYLALGVAHLLLIGDPDPDDQGDDFDSVGDVPMLMTWPRGAYTVADSTDADPASVHRCRIAPTDMYYGELSRAHWDQDGDGFPGERSNDRFEVYMGTQGSNNQGVNTYQFGCDFDMELDVARIPFSSLQRVDSHLAAQIEYQSTPMNPMLQAVRRRVLLSMAELDSTTDEASLGRQLEGDLDAHASALPFFCTGLYQSTPYDVLLTEGALPGIWGDKAGAGLVIWTGHGNSQGVYLNQGHWITWPVDLTDWRPMLDTTDVGGLNADITRSVAIAMSCLNARPSSGFNLAHRLMDDASIGVFANTGCGFYRQGRVSDWGTMNLCEDVGYQISRNLLEGDTIGAALAEVRRIGDPNGWTDAGGDTASSGVEAQGLLVANAFGDPTGRYIID